jgi:hypothetical protein
MLPIRESVMADSKLVPFGKEILKDFPFEEGWLNLNHGISSISSQFEEY